MGDRFDNAIKLAAGAAGLTAYVYVLGGVVTWLRMATAGFSGDVGVGGLDNTRLLSTGLRVAAFEAGLLVLVCVVVAGILGFAIARRGQLPSYPETGWGLRQAWSTLWTLGGMVGLGLPLLAIVVGMSTVTDWRRIALVAVGGVVAAAAALAMLFGDPPRTSKPSRRRPGWKAEGGACPEKTDDGWPPKWRQKLADAGTWIGRTGRRFRAFQGVTGLVLAINLAVSIAAVPALQGTILLAATALVYLGPVLKWPRRASGRGFVSSTGVWLAIAASTAVAVAWVATPPVAFTRAELVLSDSRLSGAYLGSNSDGFSVGVCAPAHGKASADLEHSRPTRLIFVPRGSVRTLRVGGPRYEFDPVGRPSIGQVAVAVIATHNPREDRPPLAHALHGRAEKIC